MKALRNLSLLAVVAIVALLSSCSKTPEYAKLIPDDAIFTARFNTPKMIKSASADDIKDIQKESQKFIEQSQLSAAGKEVFEKIIEDPKSSGIDFTETFMAYVKVNDRKEEVALVGEVSSSSDLTENLNILAKEGNMDKVKEKNDVSYMMFDRRTAIFFDSKSFILTEKIRHEDEDEFISRVTRKFSADGEGTMAKNENFSKLCGSDGLVQVLISGKGLKKSNTGYGTLMAGASGLDMEKMDLLYDFNSEPGALTLTGEVITEDDKWKEYIANGDEMMQDISGDLCKYTPLDAFTCMMNLDGEKLDEQIKKYGIYDLISGPEGDKIREIIRSLKGDASVSFTGINRKGEPEVFSYIGTNNEAIVNLIKDETRGNSQTDGDNYVMTIQNDFDNPYNMMFCYKNNITSICATHGTKPFYTPSAALPKDYISGKKFYMYISANFVKKIINDSGEYISDPQKLDKFISLFVDGEAFYEGGGKLVARINMKDRDKDALETLGDFLEENIQ